MSKLTHQNTVSLERQVAELARRQGIIERILQQIEGVVSPFDGSAQPGMFSPGSIGGGDVGAGTLNGSHLSSLSIASILASAGTQLQGNTYLGAGAVMILASGVSQPITSPGVALVAGGSLAASTTYYVSFSWYDGANETTVFAPATAIKTTPTSLSITVTLPIAPSGATQARIYMDTAAFGVAGGKLQQAIVVSTTAQTQVTITAFSSAGAASISSTTFPASGAAVVEPAAAVDSTGAAQGWVAGGNGRFRFLGPTVNTQFWLYDDFYGSNAHYPNATGTGFGAYWATGFAGTGATVTAGVSSTTDPGVMQLATGTTTTGRAGVRTGNSFATGTARLRFAVYFMVDVIANGTNSFQIFMGLTTDTAQAALTAAVSGIGFQLNNDTTGNTLTLAVADGGSLNQAVSNPAVVLVGGAWHFAEFEVDAGRTAVNWWVDFVKQNPITTHIPAAATAMSLAAGITKTATGAGIISRTLNIDTIALHGDYVSG